MDFFLFKQMALKKKKTKSAFHSGGLAAVSLSHNKWYLPIHFPN
jgi:hypothetical protein